MTEIFIKLIFVVIYGLVIWYYFRVVNGRMVFPTVVNLFIAYQVTQFIGTVVLADFLRRSFDFTRLIAMLVGTILLVGGCAFANYLLRFSPQQEYRDYQERRVVFDIEGGVYGAILLIGVISCVVGVAYTSALGYNMVGALVTSFMTSDSSSVTALTYSDLRSSVIRDMDFRYLAPGYAGQFTTVLLPLAFYLMYFRALVKKRSPDKVIAAVLALASVYFLSAQGIRSYVVVFAVTFLLLTARKYGPFGSLFPSGRRAMPFLIGAAAVGIFALFTLLGRRGAAVQPSSGAAFTAITDFFDRLIFVSVENQLKIMDYFQGLPLSGSGWFQSVTNVLPRGVIREAVQGWFGISTIFSAYGGDMSLYLYRLFYGGDGSMPLDMWSSIWLEFGWLGTIIVPFILGFFLQWLNILFLRGKKTVTQNVIMVMCAFALYNIFEPLAFFLSGFVTLMILLQLIKLIQRFEAKRGFAPTGAVGFGLPRVR